MSDFFTFRDSLEPEASRGLQAQTGGGAGRQIPEELEDFTVEATDGEVGEVDDATYVAGESNLLVRTGGTIFSKKVMLPAGLVERVDRDSKTVHVDRSQDEIKNAPEFDEEIYRDQTYRDQLAGYYAR